MFLWSHHFPFNVVLFLQLGEQLAQLVPASGVDIVELEDEGTCVRFSPLMTSAGNWREHSYTVYIFLLLSLNTFAVFMQAEFKAQTGMGLESPKAHFLYKLGCALTSGSGGGPELEQSP